MTAIPQMMARGLNRGTSEIDRDYALLMVGHTYSAKKIRPDRDLTNLHEAYNAYQQLVTLYPNSEHAPEGQARIGQLRETLAEHEHQVAQFYYRNKRWQGALWRLEYLQENYPEYSKMDAVNTMLDNTNNKINEIQETYRKIIEERQKTRTH